MSEAVMVALITGGLSLLGVIIANNKNAQAMDVKMDKQQGIMETKIDELTRKVEKHNNLVERTYHLEGQDELREEQIKVINHRISDLEAFHK